MGVRKGYPPSPFPHPPPPPRPRAKTEKSKKALPSASSPLPPSPLSLPLPPCGRKKQKTNKKQTPSASRAAKFSPGPKLAARPRRRLGSPLGPPPARLRAPPRRALLEAFSAPPFQRDLRELAEKHRLAQGKTRLGSRLRLGRLGGWDRKSGECPGRSRKLGGFRGFLFQDNPPRPQAFRR